MCKKIGHTFPLSVRTADGVLACLLPVLPLRYVASYARQLALESSYPVLPRVHVAFRAERSRKRT